MAKTGPDAAPVSPQFRRGLMLSWIGLVLLIGACIFLGTWWGINQQDQAAITARDVSPSAVVTLATPLPPTDSPALEEGGDTAGLSVSTSTPLPVNDLSFGYGIQIQGETNTAQVFDQVEQLGLRWVRQPVSWEEIEATAGGFDWDALDRVFAETSARGLRVLVTITGAPDWTRSVTARNMDGPPDDVNEYVRFVSRLITRYNGQIHAVEVWQEMNHDTAWYTAGGLNANSYMALLVPTTEAIKSLDPGIIVISGGLNPTGVDDGVMAIDDFRYLQQLIDAGLLDHVDCVGAHHQGYNFPPDQSYDASVDDPDADYRQTYENRHHSWSFYSTMRGYHDLIIAAGKSTPLCVTEFGWAAGEDLPPAEVPGFVYDNSLQEQADFTVQAFGLMHEWEFVRLAIVSNLDYSPEEAGSGEGPDNNLTEYYRIVLPDGTPRPVFNALQSMPKLP
ncbi:MAG: cellulase family glycosylhydrolase [Anaerolineae bacterium]|nr:cellulase family glycosylhydrolase [Anaerolineae bacterium]